MEYTLHIRDEAPADEVRVAIANFGNAYPHHVWSADGKCILWSDFGWNCGYATHDDREDLTYAVATDTTGKKTYVWRGQHFETVTDLRIFQEREAVK